MGSTSKDGGSMSLDLMRNSRPVTSLSRAKFCSNLRVLCARRGSTACTLSHQLVAREGQIALGAKSSIAPRHYRCTSLHRRHSAFAFQVRRIRWTVAASRPWDAANLLRQPRRESKVAIDSAQRRKRDTRGGGIGCRVSASPKIHIA